MQSKKYLSKQQIEEMGANLLKAYVEAGNTIVTNQEGVGALKEIDRIEEMKKNIEEYKKRLERETTRKKPHKKYSTNLLPSKTRLRTKHK